MKDKKAIRKNIIILIIIIVGSTAIWFLYPIIQLSLFNIFTPKSERQIKIENYIDEYNRTCDTDDKVKIINYYEVGPAHRCKLEFSDGRFHNEDSIVSFFLKLHNEFGYDFLCNNEIEKKRGFQAFKLENIEFTYGGTIPIGQESNNIDVTLCSLGKTINVDQETIGKFKGVIYVYSLEDVVVEQ